MTRAEFFQARAAMARRAAAVATNQTQRRHPWRCTEIGRQATGYDHPALGNYRSRVFKK
jgi:hypothetical protein